MIMPDETVQTNTHVILENKKAVQTMGMSLHQIAQALMELVGSKAR